ncbi:MAG: Fe-S cluster assembly protein SufD [Leptolyngbyaceae bacterium]|nr:Fe-S cluster assembly protein SufD [Leptolyngbyaceae bacterium]
MTIQVVSPNNKAGERVQEKFGFEQLLKRRSPLSPDLNADISDYMQALRTNATTALERYSFPSTRDEEWRFTNLAPITALDWSAPMGETPEVTEHDLRNYRLPDVGPILVMVNGHYRADLSVGTTASGVTVGALSQPGVAATVGPKLDQYLGQQLGLEQAFTTLNTASMTDVVVVWVAKGVAAPQSIQIQHISTMGPTGPTLSHPRCLVVAEANSAVKIVEDYVCLGSETASSPYFTNPVTEIYLEDNAAVTHVRLQRDDTTSFHIGKTAVSQARTSRYTCHAINLGARISRHNLEVFQAGEQTETTLNGLAMVTGQQLTDTHSLIAYQHPHGTSKQLQKCIIDGSAHAVFNGKVNVPQAAQLTDASQLNRNLLLSTKGKVDTKPQLEIVADNVKCTHGATVSQLKADEVFYLQSRGIDATRAQNLLIYAFAAEVFETIPIVSLKQSLVKTVEQFIQH